MRDNQNCTFVINKVLLQPSDCFGVKVVGRLVKQQHVRGFKQEFAQCYTTLFTTRKRIDICVVRRAAQCLHAHIDLAVQIPKVGCIDFVLQLGHLISSFVRVIHRQFVIAIQHGLFIRDTEHHVFADRQAFVQLWFLREISDARAFGGPSFTNKVFVLTRHDPHQGGFARAVDAYDTNFHAGQEVQTYLFKDLFAAGVSLRYAVHEVDEFIAGHFEDAPLGITS